MRAPSYQPKPPRRDKRLWQITYVAPKGAYFDDDGVLHFAPDPNHAKCDRCGRVEHIDLLDAKPDEGDNPYSGEWGRLECIACYGPGYGGWSPAGTRRPDLISICDELHGLYLGWRLMNWIAERRVAFRMWRFRRQMAARKR